MSGVKRDALIYGAGIVMRRAATLIMLPIYTRLLTPRDYGLLQMLDMTLDIASILMSAGMTAGVMCFYFKASTDRERNAVIVTATYLVLGMNMLGGILLALSAAPIHQHVLGGAGARFYVYVAASNFAVTELLSMPLLLMQIQGRAGLFSITSLVRLTGQLTLNIIFLVVLRMGPLGILVSSLVINLTVGGTAMAWMIRQVGMTPSRRALLNLRRFGVPYQLATAATFVLQFGDRFFLQASHGLAAVGLYAFAYQFGFLLDQVGGGPLMRAWQPRRFAAVKADRVTRERSDDETFHILTIVVVSFALGMALFARPALSLIAAPAFHPAAGLVPIVLAAFVLQIWGSVAQFGIDAAEQTRYTTLIVWTSALLIVALYAVLIPPFGPYGAAWATLIAFAVRARMFAYFSARLWPQSYDWPAQFRVLGLAVAAYLLDHAIPVRSVVLDLALAAVIYLTYVAVIARRELPPALRDQLRERVQRSLGAWRRETAAA